MSGDSSVHLDRLALRVHTPGGEVVVELTRASAQVLAAGLVEAAGAESVDLRVAEFADCLPARQLTFKAAKAEGRAPRPRAVVRLGK